MTFDNETKAGENLLDIGYYRLGFYCFPFEFSYPQKHNRDHRYKDGIRFEDVIALYYFDFDLRNLFLRYISRIEINFRTKLIYYASIKYKENPYWYVDCRRIKSNFLQSSKYNQALQEVAKEDVIKHDLSKHPDNAYVPAWKAIEFMSFGTVIMIYDNLLDGALRLQIAKACGVDSPSRFSNYINTVRCLRNSCAHGQVLFDLKLAKAISTDGAVKVNAMTKTRLSGACAVLLHLLFHVSQNRVEDLQNGIRKAYNKVNSEAVRSIIRECSAWF